MNFQLFTRLSGTVFVTLLIASTAALAGGANGGGGGGEKCMGYNDPMRPASVKPELDWAGGTTTLLDFWEAENGLLPFRSKLTIPRTSLPVETQVQNAIKKMNESNPDFAAAIEASYQHILQARHHDERDMSIEPPTDTLEPFDGPHCKRVGIGSYDDVDDVLDISRPTYEPMDNTDKAGFWLHEAVYRILRLGSGENTSTEARLIVANLFSDQPLEPVIAHRMTKSFMCERQPNPDYEIEGVKFLLHTDGNLTVLVPVSVQRIVHQVTGQSYKSVIDAGGEYFWLATEYPVDWKGAFAQNSQMISTAAVDGFNGQLSDLLLHIGQPIDESKLMNVKYQGPANPSADIPIRTKYYGIKFYADLGASEVAGPDGYPFVPSSILSTPTDYQRGVISLTASVGEDFGPAFNGAPRNMQYHGRQQPNSMWAVTCRQF